MVLVTFRWAVARIMINIYKCGLEQVKIKYKVQLQ